jgi:hypothetical protein
VADEFKQAVEKINKGDEAAGRVLLQSYLAKNPFNAKAWLWMATVAESDTDRIACLKRALRIDPNNAAARKALENLAKKTAPQADSRAVFPPTPAPKAVARPAKKGPSKAADLVSNIIGILVLVAIGVGALVTDYYYNYTAEAYLREGRRAAASVTDEVTYWRRGAVEYCKVKYQFLEQGAVYENEGTEDDLDLCDRIAASGVVEIEYLAGNPGKNRMPWNYPEDYQFMHFGWFCAGPAFLGALIMAVWMMVPKRKNP